MERTGQKLRLKKLGINTYKDAVIYIRSDCSVCRSEGFEAPSRVQIHHNSHTILATLNTIDSDLLTIEEAGLSTYAWDLLGAKEGDEVYLSHPEPLESLSYVHAKIYGNALKEKEVASIITDIVSGYFSDIQIASFLTACATGHLNKDEVIFLTQAMINAGQRLTWPSNFIVDKHCVGGLPGNRTSLIIVPIVTAFGLTMPKTSSRAITSPAGTADTMEVLAPVNLNMAQIQEVVKKENGCIVWGGAAALSPADDILIGVEKAIDLDSEGQLVASILSKKIAAGSTHLVIDIPIGPTAKVRTQVMAELLKNYLETVGKALGIEVRSYFSDGSQPIGRGIGPALEAKDVLAVLQNDKSASPALRKHSLTLAGHVLEFSKTVAPGTGKKIATELLNSGKAWKKFQAICHAQGGLFEPPTAAYTAVVIAKQHGIVSNIDNRRIARVAKLAGAPTSKAAGVELLTPLNTRVSPDQPLFIIHAETQGELKYALNYTNQDRRSIIQIENL